MVINKIRELRNERKITQIQLARDLRITRQTVIAIENNRYNPSLELTLKIARYFSLPVEEVFSLKEE